MSPCNRLMLAAADRLEHNARALRDAHTCAGHWQLTDAADRAALDDYITEMAMVHQLRGCVRAAQGLDNPPVIVELQFADRRDRFDGDAAEEHI